MNTHGIDFDRVRTSDTAFSITTPSFRGYASRLAPGVVGWRVIERDTRRQLGEGSAPTSDDAIDQMTEVMAANI